jgi:S-adenosylmethionine uptake transporter
MSPQPYNFRQSLDSIGLACAGWFFFCLCDAITKYLSIDYDPLQILAVSSIIGIGMTGGWIFMNHGWRGFVPFCWKWYLARMVNVIGSSYCVNHALAHIPLADFYGIVFLTPMMTTLIAVIFLKEQIGRWRWSAVIAGFIGVMIVIGPVFQDHNIGYFYALAGTLFISSNALVLHKIGYEPVIARYAFYPFVATTVFFIPLLAGKGSFQMPHDPLHWALFLIMAPLSLIGMLGYSAGFARARDTSMIAPFHYSQMIWGAMLGFFIFRDVPGPSTIAGSLIIVASGLMVIWREHVKHVRIATEIPP